MKLVELDTKAAKPKKNTRYLARRRDITVAHTWRGQPRYYWRNRLPLWRRLNRLWAWLAGR